MLTLEMFSFVILNTVQLCIFHFARSYNCLILWAKDKSEIRLHLYYANPWIAGQSSPAQCQAPLRNNYRCMHLANIFNYFSTQIFSIEIFFGHIFVRWSLDKVSAVGIKTGMWTEVRVMKLCQDSGDFSQRKQTQDKLVFHEHWDLVKSLNIPALIIFLIIRGSCLRNRISSHA